MARSLRAKFLAKLSLNSFRLLRLESGNNLPVLQYVEIIFVVCLSQMSPPYLASRFTDELAGS